MSFGMHPKIPGPTITVLSPMTGMRLAEKNGFDILDAVKSDVFWFSEMLQIAKRTQKEHPRTKPKLMGVIDLRWCVA